MFTITISLKTFMLIVAFLSIYVTINLWIFNAFNNKLASKIKSREIYPFIDLSSHMLKYMFLSVFLLFKSKKIVKDAIYEYNCKRLKMLKELSYVYSGDEYDLERVNLEKDIHKYEVYSKLKSLEKKSLFNRKT